MSNGGEKSGARVIRTGFTDEQLWGSPPPLALKFSRVAPACQVFACLSTTPFRLLGKARLSVFPTFRLFSDFGCAESNRSQSSAGFRGPENKQLPISAAAARCAGLPTVSGTTLQMYDHCYKKQLNSLQICLIGGELRYGVIWYVRGRRLRSTVGTTTLGFLPRGFPLASAHRLILALPPLNTCIRSSRSIWLVSPRVVCNSAP